MKKFITTNIWMKQKTLRHNFPKQTKAGIGNLYSRILIKALEYIIENIHINKDELFSGVFPAWKPKSLCLFQWIHI